MRKVAALGRRFTFALLVACLWAVQAAAAPAPEVDEAARLAQAREGERRTSYFEVGWFGSIAGWQPDLAELNELLAGEGFARLDRTALLSTGGGYLSVGGWRIGGFGAEGEIATKKGPNFAQLETSFGAGHFARVLRLGRRASLDVGVFLGGGRAELILSRGSPSTIEDAVGDAYDTVLEMDFLAAGPVVGFQYNLWGWMGLRLEAGHLYTLGSWTHSASGAKVAGGPPLTGPYASVTFGFVVGGPIPVGPRFQWDDEDDGIKVVY